MPTREGLRTELPGRVMTEPQTRTVTVPGGNKFQARTRRLTQQSPAGAKPCRVQQKYHCSVYFIFTHFIYETCQGTEFLIRRTSEGVGQEAHVNSASSNGCPAAPEGARAVNSLWMGYLSCVLRIPTASVGRGFIWHIWNARRRERIHPMACFISQD